MATKGPFVAKYLDKIIEVMNRSLDEHPRTFAVRFDLQIPAIEWGLAEDRLIDRFISSLKGKIKWARIKSARQSKTGRVHETGVRYVWARELPQRGRVHYHFVLFLNRDAFNAIGVYELGRDNLFNRVLEAWAGALRMDVDDAVGLVHFPENAIYRVTEGDVGSQDDLLHRASYLAKVSTKVVGSRHSFGSSRERRVVRSRFARPRIQLEV